MKRNDEGSSAAAAFANRRLVAGALRKGVRDAYRRHKQAGQPVVVWRRGKIVLVPPEEIPDL